MMRELFNQLLESKNSNKYLNEKCLECSFCGSRFLNSCICIKSNKHLNIQIVQNVVFFQFEIEHFFYQTQTVSAISPRAGFLLPNYRTLWPCLLPFQNMTTDLADTLKSRKSENVYIYFLVANLDFKQKIVTGRSSQFPQHLQACESPRKDKRSSLFPDGNHQSRKKNEQKFIFRFNFDGFPEQLEYNPLC